MADVSWAEERVRGKGTAGKGVDGRQRRVSGREIVAGGYGWRMKGEVRGLLAGE
ncbi:hypothetical protein OIU76_003776 [Salix suchowensis]|nr:hypothetical protein OIU76_003776 [Salix suchowensis]